MTQLEPEAPPDDHGALVERPHPLTPLIRGWVVLLAMAIGIGKEFVPDGSGEAPRLPPLLWIAAGVGIAALIAAGMGFVTWRFTRFVTEVDELRIDTGLLTRHSRRIAYDKVQAVDVVQPLAARLFGLAEVVIDIGSGSRPRLRFLSLSRAYGMRDHLLARAHARPEAVIRHADVTSVMTDLGAEDQVLTRVGVPTLVLAAVTSQELLGAIAGLAFSAGLAIALGHPWVGLGIAFPAASAIVGVVSHRVIRQFNYTLSRREAGLRISRGLTTLSSHSIPPQRIQAAQLSQSWLWRRLGLYRLDIEIIGFGALDGERDDGLTSMMLPAGTREQVQICLRAIWPGVDVDAVALTAAPLRARWLHPWSGTFLRWGHDETLVVTRHGFLLRRWQLVPTARVQSLRARQGPVSRRVRLADLAFHTAGTQVSAVAKGLDIDALAAQLPALTALITRADLPDPTIRRPPPAPATTPTERPATPAEPDGNAGRA